MNVRKGAAKDPIADSELPVGPHRIKYRIKAGSTSLSLKCRKGAAKDPIAVSELPVGPPLILLENI